MKVNKSQKIGMISLGCAKNLVNSEQMMFLLNSAGFEVTGETQGVDAVIVNTCAFIESAKTEAIETILDLAAAKADGEIGKIIVAGCLPQRYSGEIMQELPEIDAVIGAGSFGDIVGAVQSALEGKAKPALFGDINAPVSEDGRVITTPPAWAYLKIAEGCDNRCAYCVIPDIRGRFRSRTVENIAAEAAALAARGVKELILVAQDVTRYGLDMYGAYSLPRLLRSISEIDGIRWIRLHYLYPDEISDELIDVIRESGKIVKYLDIPIQHINDGILRKMNRRGTGTELRALFRRLRERIPGVVLRTSVIAGLPGEGEAEFEELCAFLREAKIERAGVFAYSPEEGTPAALLDRPDDDVAARRAELLTDIQSRIIDEFNASRIGRREVVLVEGRSEGRLFGRSFAESPEVDGYIYLRRGDAAAGEFADVRIVDAEDGAPVGEIVV